MGVSNVREAQEAQEKLEKVLHALHHKDKNGEYVLNDDGFSEKKKMSLSNWIELSKDEKAWGEVTGRGGGWEFRDCLRQHNEDGLNPIEKSVEYLQKNGINTDEMAFINIGSKAVVLEAKDADGKSVAVRVSLDPKEKEARPDIPEMLQANFGSLQEGVNLDNAKVEVMPKIANSNDVAKKAKEMGIDINLTDYVKMAEKGFSKDVCSLDNNQAENYAFVLNSKGKALAVVVDGGAVVDRAPALKTLNNSNSSEQDIENAKRIVKRFVKAERLRKEVEGSGDVGEDVPGYDFKLYGKEIDYRKKCKDKMAGLRKKFVDRDPAEANKGTGEIYKSKDHGDTLRTYASQVYGKDGGGR